MQDIVTHPWPNFNSIQTAGALLLTWFNFNPSMDKESHAL